MARKCWCFTLNNYTDDEYSAIIGRLPDLSRYYVVGVEVGDSGTKHLQGYASFRVAKRLNAVKDILSNRAHCEAARGSAGQNRKYCTKDGDFVEGGEVPKTTDKVTRNDLAKQFREAFAGGMSGVASFADEQPGTWFFSGHNLLRNTLTLMAPEPRPDISVRWIYGPPGVGKSRKAHEELPDAYIKEPRTKWWNGYYGEKTCILDDFGPGGIDINHLLRWFDRYKCLVENKGGMVPLLVSTFIVTSNFHPNQIFKFGEETHPQLPALERRITLEEME
ncbi:replication associated protein [Lake Sarah-associated circular virus-34]|uniref:replication associated protein n=1 Tax=Lake Sarah-associated circular virus-34 TaxID=1685762 RepID=UPI000778158C|nr:replication associated protein [Lake Sarah-associated circular virus-34]ALE29733.1 replication associated protein [Lake Sarah-associated circular virus-34]